MINIKQFLNSLDNFYDKSEIYEINGWVRTLRTSSNELSFCNINDGSNVNGLQIVISLKEISEELFKKFNNNIKTGCYINVSGLIVLSPAKGQKYELVLKSFKLIGNVSDNYILGGKSRMNMDTLRDVAHLRPRTSIFGCIFRIRSKLMKSLHDFYENEGFLHLDPNIITINECEGGAGVFQLTEHDISEKNNLKYNNEKYNWGSDHFQRPAYLTVSSQLQLEALACSLGNVYTMNKSFRSEHSSTSKHVSEFTHLEIEMINNNLNDLMIISEKMIKYCINEILEKCSEEIENLNRFISKGIKDKLEKLLITNFHTVKYSEIIEIINQDIREKKVKKLELLKEGDDLSSAHENYITEKYGPTFVTHWPLSIKSFYMKQCLRDNKYCESYDLLMPYGVGELIGASMREEDYNKLRSMMTIKGVNAEELKFYLDLREYGTCPHGGFGLGFDRLLMLITGIQNIKDVIPFPVYYKSCKY